MSGYTGMETFPLSAEAVERLIAGVRDAKPVSGLTHNFYRYPARFSPTFARAFIAECTEPGELVLDPFVGGGTTLVEAQALGRRATGVDLSSLAVFVSTVKTTPLPEPLTAELQGWFAALMPKLNLRRTSVHFADWAAQGYYRNMECARTWRIRKLLELALGEVQRLSDRRAVEFSRCAILRTGQWALDGRKTIPSAAGFRQALEANFRDMLAGVRALSNSTRSNDAPSPIRVGGDERGKLAPTVSRSSLLHSVFLPIAPASSRYGEGRAAATADFAQAANGRRLQSHDAAHVARE